MKYQAIVKKDVDGNGEILGEFKKRELAVEALINYGDKHISYTLDNKNERISGLEMRNWYVCGCGPYQLLIEEIE